MKKKKELLAILILLLLFIIFVSASNPKEVTGIIQAIDANLGKVTELFGLSNEGFNLTGLFGLSANNPETGPLKCVDYFYGDTFPGASLSSLIDSKNVSLWDPSANSNNPNSGNIQGNEKNNNSDKVNPGKGNGNNKIFERQICFTDSGNNIFVSGRI